MTRQDYGDETLMAYADGALDAVTARAVKDAAEADPDIAARIALFARTREVLAEAAAARPLAPLSPALEARVRETLAAGAAAPDNVVAFRPRGWRAVAFRPAAAAAAVALAVGAAGGFLVSQVTGDRTQGGLRVATLAAPEIVRVLDTVPSGQRVGIPSGEVATIASFVNADGEFCREFEFEGAAGGSVVSVACLTAAGWQPRLAVVAVTGDDAGYAPASSLETLDAYLGAVGAGAPLSAEEEAAVLRERAG